MPFLPPNQQRQSTEGMHTHIRTNLYSAKNRENESEAVHAPAKFITVYSKQDSV